MPASIYDPDLDKNPANYQPLTPLSLPRPRGRGLSRARPRSSTAACGSPMREFYARARRLASALAQRGIGQGDTVAVMLANTPAMLEAHYGVPMTGACSTRSTPGSMRPIIAFSSITAKPRC